MEQQAPVIKLVPINQNVVPRPYTDTTYLAQEGIYALPDIEQLAKALNSIYVQQGLEVVQIKPAEITLRRYHDNPTRSDQPDQKVPEGSDGGQPADL